MATSDPSSIRGDAADELTRLAAANAQLAEREGAALQRAAELGEINRLLVESTLKFSPGADPEAFLESLLRTLADGIGASPVSLFEHDAEARTLTLRITYQNGNLRRGPSGDEVPLFAAPFPADITPAWAESVRNGGRLYVPAQNPDAPRHSWPGLDEWFGRIGISDAALMVLFDGDEPLGSLGLSWTNGRKLQPADCPYIEALGQQAAAALRLVKLADRARDAAVTRERAAELARANDVLQRSTAMLTRQGEPVAFLESVLRDAAAACGAMGAGVVRHDADTDALQMAAWVGHGERVDIPTDPRMVLWRASFPAHAAPGWDLVVHDNVLWFDNEGEAGVRWPQGKAWHRAMGHRMIAIMPLLVSGQPLGFFKLCFAEPTPPTKARLDQARTLAGHAALALQLTRLTGEVRREAEASAALGERNRIARDLHDTLAQGFTGILAQLGVVEGALDATGAPDADGLRRALGRALELARGSLAEARRSVGLLRGDPPPLPDDDPATPLDAALRALLHRMTAGTHLRVRLEVEPGLPKLPARVQETLHRIAQEALTNSLKHAGPRASEFSLRLGCDEGRVRLSARDDGCGFDPDAENSGGEGFGLVGMRERAALAGGVATVRSAPGEGVEITVELPFACPEET